MNLITPMKKLLVVCVTAFALSGPVYAADAGDPQQHFSHYHSEINEQYSWLFRWFWSVFNHVHDRYCGHGGTSNGGQDVAHGGNTAQVPELGGASAGLALLLLGGLIALRRETRKRS